MYNNDDANNMVLVGGRDSTGLLNDTWTWDGTNWTQQAPADSPPARELASMVIDDAHGYLVLFGGKGSSGLLNDTWTWDGTNWTQQTPATSPPARDAASLAHVDGGSTTLFGGENPALLNDTWQWDGTTWTQLATTSSPPARAFASMAYFDAAGSKVVLFGGRGTSGDLSDTWTLTGASWTQMNVAVHPTAREAASFAMDDNTALIVLFGGAAGASDLSDTWTWNASGWTKQTPAVHPPARHGASMGNNDNGDGVLFGGSASGALNDTWVWRNSNGAATSDSVTSSVNPSTVGASVTFTATVAPTPTGGSTEFDDNGTVITGCAAVTLVGGAATCTTTLGSAGSHDILASYSGDDSSLASSGLVVQDVNPATTTVSPVASSADPATTGQAVTYSVSIAPAPDGGTVAFADNGTTIPGCGAAPVTAGRATCSVTYSAAGSHSITAAYSGDVNYAASTAPSALAQSTVAAVPTPAAGAAGGRGWPVGAALIAVGGLALFATRRGWSV